MRRFSQRNSLVTLSDINITPLLDLAFVLLIIFVITAPLLDPSIDLRLPEGGRVAQRVDRNRIRTVEIDKQGRYRLNQQLLPLDQLAEALAQAHRDEPDLVVRIRADRECLAQDFYPVVDRCTQIGIRNFSFSTQGPARR
ncbi:MAG: biopolymer transporter ExbD [Verrucomicrobia bacterium]|nr:biopolymer transporter ExbD [Verrucomicrobiota bacterium]